MNFLYVPFTYISPVELKPLEACFGRPVLLQPSEQEVPGEMNILSDEGRIRVYTPVRGGEERLAAVLDEYRRWADLHQGSELAYLGTYGDTVPFYDDSSVSKIRSDIQRPGSGGDIETDSQSLWRARIFLHMAQDYDRQDREIERDMVHLQEQERGLMRELKGLNEVETGGSGGPATIPTDTGAYLTGERLTAWAGLYSQVRLEELGGPHVFVTGSRDVRDALLDAEPAVRRLCRIDRIPAPSDASLSGSGFQGPLSTALNDIACASQIPSEIDWPVPVAAEDTTDFFELSIYGAEGIIPGRFFKAFAAPDMQFVDTESDPGAGLHTLVAFYEPSLM